MCPPMSNNVGNIDDDAELDRENNFAPGDRQVTVLRNDDEPLMDMLRRIDQQTAALQENNAHLMEMFRQVVLGHRGQQIEMPLLLTRPFTLGRIVEGHQPRIDWVRWPDRHSADDMSRIADGIGNDNRIADDMSRDSDETDDSLPDLISDDDVVAINRYIEGSWKPFAHGLRHMKCARIIENAWHCYKN